MKKDKFVMLATNKANQTSNIRVSPKMLRGCGVDQIKDEVTNRIGQIIDKLQELVENGCFCCADNEYLLIYDFGPPLYVSELEAEESANDGYFCNLSMVVKPLSKIAEEIEISGKPVHVVVNGTTGEMLNTSQYLIELGVCTPEELEQEDSEPPMRFGNLNDVVTSRLTTISSDLMKNLVEIQSQFREMSKMGVSASVIGSFADEKTKAVEGSALISPLSSVVTYGYQNAINSPEPHGLECNQVEVMRSNFSASV